MDHFAGFDHLLRVCLGRSAGLKVYGPAAFIGQMEHKLAAYTWDLADRYPTDLVIIAHELHPDGCLQRARFRSRRRFEREALPALPGAGGVLLTDPLFRVRTVALEHHGLASLAFAFEESQHINVWKSRLEALRLPTGPWLTELKTAVRAGAPDDTLIRVHWRTREGGHDEEIALGRLKAEVLQMLPGQRVCYVTDVADNPGNRARLAAFLRDADLLFIEAVFLDQDREQAHARAHLTARAPGGGEGPRAVSFLDTLPRARGRAAARVRQQLRRGAMRGAQGPATRASV